MSKNINKIIAVTLTVVCTILMLYNANEITKRKESFIKNGYFFTEKQDIDVLFLGSSHMKYILYPMELYADYGLVSYNYGTSSSTIPQTYLIFKQLIKYHKPKLVVLDCYILSNNCIVKEGYLSHQAFDCIPLNKNKIEAIKELYAINKFKIFDNSNATELLFPFITYHNRWNSIKKEDFDFAESVQKGATENCDIAKPVEYKKIEGTEYLKNTTLGMQYLYKIIKECKLNGIDILLVYLPFPANETFQKEANTMVKISKEQNVKCINFLDLDIVNLNVDCKDTKSHINVSGGYKLTDYLGKYIVDNYNIENHYNDKKYAHWHNEYDKYVEYKLDNFSKAKNYNIYLLLASDKHFNYKIIIRDKEIFNDKMICDLFDNVGVDANKVKNTNINVIEIDNVKNKVKYSYSGKVNQADYKIDFEVIDQENNKVLNKKSYK